MADQENNTRLVVPSAGGAKKELTNEQLKVYIHKARAKIRKLEEENKSLVSDVKKGTSASTSASEEGLLNSLREEVKLWKANYQQQVEAAAAPSVEENDPESLKRALQDVVDAQAETLVWKEKAAEAAADEGLEGRLAVLEEEAQQTKVSSELAEKALKTIHEEESAQLQAVIESLRSEKVADEDAARQAQQAVEAAKITSDELETQVETLVRDAGALEHRLVHAQLDRDRALAQFSEQEKESRRLLADAAEAAEEKTAVARQLKEQELQREQLEQKLAQALAQSVELRSEVDKVRSAGEESEREGVAEAFTARDEAVASLTNSRAELGVLEERVSVVGEEFLVVKRERDEAAAKTGELKRELDRIRAELEQAVADSTNARAELSVAEERVSVVGEELLVVKREKDEATAETGELDRVRAEMEQVVADFTNAKAELGMVKEKVSVVGGELIVVKRERDEAAAATGELARVRAEMEQTAVETGELDRVRAELEQAVAGFANVRAELGVAEEKVSITGEELLAVNLEKDEVTAATSGLKGELDRVRAELEQEKGRVAMVEQVREELAGDKEAKARVVAAAVEATGEEITRSSAALREELEAERDALGARLTETIAAKSCAEKDAEALRGKAEALVEQVDELHQQLANASAALEVKNAELSRTASGAIDTVGDVAATSETPDEGMISGDGGSAREATLVARCEELELEAAASAEKVVVLETKLTDNIAMARLEVQDKEILTDEFAQVMPEEATQIRSKASPEPQHEEIEAGVVALAEKEKQVGVQQYLESMLQEAESSAEESKEVVREMEGVIAGLREDEAVLSSSLLGLTEEVASAKEDASRAQEALESEKEKVQSMIERVDAAEKMVGAFEDKEAVTAREAGELTEILSQEKAALNSRLLGLTAEVVAAKEAASIAQEALESEKAGVRVLAERADAAEKVVRELEDKEAATEAAASVAAEDADALSKEKQERALLEKQLAAHKEKIKKAVNRLRSLKGEKEAATEELASTSALLETSQKDLADAEGRCRSLEKTATEGRDAGNDKLSAMEEEASGLRKELKALSQGLQEADDRARVASEEVSRLQEELDGHLGQWEGLQEALRLANESSARVPALEADLDAQRAGRRQSEAELDAFKEGAREITNLKESSARESEEIVGALQGQVESSNKKLEEAQQESAAFKGEVEMKAEKTVLLEVKGAEMLSKMEELELKLTAADVALKERELEHAKTTTDKDQAIASGKKGKEEMEVKVKRLKSLLSKLQKSSQGKDAELAALKAPSPPPKAFTVELRVRHEGSIWCLLKTTPSAQAPTGGKGNVSSQNSESKKEEQTQWVNEDKAHAWIAGDSSRSDEALWPAVVQDTFEERVADATAGARDAKAEAASTFEEMEALASEFTKYKARAHTALKKAAYSGADDKRKDEVIAGLESERNELVVELRETTATLDEKLSNARDASNAREDDLHAVTEELETAQGHVRELQGSLKDQERKVAQLQEAEDGHSEELSTLRDARDELKSQLKATKAQANESSSIAQRLQEELQTLAKERAAGDGRGNGRRSTSDSGWAGNQIVSTNDGLQTTGESPHGLSNRSNFFEDRVSSPISLSSNPVGNARDGLHEKEPSTSGGRESTGQSMPLLAFAELERRNTSVGTQVQAEVSEIRTELAEALLRVEQLSEQELVLKATVRSLETDLKTERELSTGDTAPVNVAYLKSAIVRYMSTRDTGEQRSLLRVISTMLQLTQEEITAVEARITELERTMVGRAGNMVGGAGRRVGGVVGGVVGLVWRGGGRAGPTATPEDIDEDREG